MKTQLRKIRERRTAVARWEKMAYGRAGIPLRNKLAGTLQDWLIRELKPYAWGSFFQDILEVPSDSRNVADMVTDKVTFEDVAIEGDWQDVIEKTEPRGKPASYHSSMFEYWEIWLAAWYPRCMPFGDIRKAILQRVRKRLRRRIQVDYPDNSWILP